MSKDSQRNAAYRVLGGAKKTLQRYEHTSKQLKKAIQKESDLLSKELDKQIDIVTPAAIIVMWRDYGWRDKRISKHIDTANEVWRECKEAGTEKSMLNILEDETGIEMTLDGVRSYHEFMYLDGKRWNGEWLNDYQYLAMLQNERQWIPTLLIAAILVAIARDEHWGFERLSRFSSQIDAVRREFGEDTKKYAEVMKDITGVDLKKLWGRRNGTENQKAVQEL